MPDDKVMSFEGRFRDPQALTAARMLTDAATKSGLSTRVRSNLIDALEYENSDGFVPLAVIANNSHALVYLRQPALSNSPGLFEKAVARFGSVKPNKKGEYRWPVRTPDEMKIVLNWLRQEHVLAPVADIGPGQVGVSTFPLSTAALVSPTSEPTRFEIGKLYTREDVTELIAMPLERRGGNWDTGYDRYDGEYFLFCNVGVAGRTGHNYANRWHDGRLVWSAKTGTRLGQPQIEELLSGKLPVHIFWRGKDRAPFTYAGLGVAEIVEDVSPVEVSWLLTDTQPPKSPTSSFPLWKRGPPPSVGERTIYKQDGPTSVYLMVLEGACVDTFPRLPAGHKVAKIGMSNDPGRRLTELNSGIPPGCVLKWISVGSRGYPSGPLAFEAEGALLEQFRLKGQWLGNEFISLSEAEVDNLLT